MNSRPMPLAGVPLHLPLHHRLEHLHDLLLLHGAVGGGDETGGLPLRRGRILPRKVRKGESRVPLVFLVKTACGNDFTDYVHDRCGFTGTRAAVEPKATWIRIFYFHEFMVVIVFSVVLMDDHAADVSFRLSIADFRGKDVAL